MRHGLFLAFITLSFMACSDDGASSESGGSTSTDPTSSTTLSGSGTTSPSTTSDPSTTTEPGTTTDDTGSTSLGSESTATEGGSSTGTGSGSGSSSTGVETSCEPPSVDGSAIGQNCMGVACPEGYDCIDHGGVVFQQLCGILCEDDCECPDGYTCMEFNIKGVVHHECAQ